MNVAYNMDCMEAMKAMPDKCFDLAVEQSQGERKRLEDSQYGS